MEKGLIVTNISRAIKFQQKRIASDFIEKTTKLRSEAKTKTDRNLCEYLLQIFSFFKIQMLTFFLGKFINNILYGKSLQDDSNHLNILLLSSKEEITYHSKESNYVGRQIIDEINGVVAVASRPRAVFLDRAFSIGTLKDVHISNPTTTSSSCI